MEINSGVMMDNFIKQNEDGYEIVIFFGKCASEISDIKKYKTKNNSFFCVRWYSSCWMCNGWRGFKSKKKLL